MCEETTHDAWGASGHESNCGLAILVRFYAFSLTVNQLAQTRYPKRGLVIWRKRGHCSHGLA